jgi:hypothetical protein
MTELTIIMCIIISAGVSAFVYMDDQFAGFDHKKSRYTRLFMGIFLGLWMFINKGSSQRGGGAAPITSQQFSVGVSPF